MNGVVSPAPVFLVENNCSPDHEKNIKLLPQNDVEKARVVCFLAFVNIMDKAGSTLVFALFEILQH